MSAAHEVKARRRENGAFVVYSRSIAAHHANKIPALANVISRAALSHQ